MPFILLMLFTTSMVMYVFTNSTDFLLFSILFICLLLLVEIRKNRK